MAQCTAIYTDVTSGVLVLLLLFNYRTLIKLTFFRPEERPEKQDFVRHSSSLRHPVEGTKVPIYQLMNLSSLCSNLCFLNWSIVHCISSILNFTIMRSCYNYLLESCSICGIMDVKNKQCIFSPTTTAIFKWFSVYSPTYCYPYTSFNASSNIRWDSKVKTSNTHLIGWLLLLVCYVNLFFRSYIVALAATFQATKKYLLVCEHVLCIPPSRCISVSRLAGTK